MFEGVDNCIIQRKVREITWSEDKISCTRNTIGQNGVTNSLTIFHKGPIYKNGKHSPNIVSKDYRSFWSKTSPSIPVRACKLHSAPLLIRMAMCWTSQDLRKDTSHSMSASGFCSAIRLGMMRIQWYAHGSLYSKMYLSDTKMLSLNSWDSAKFEGLFC